MLKNFKSLKKSFELIKNWKETWGSLVIILIPLCYSIDYTKAILQKLDYHWIISIIIFIVAWIQTNINYVSKKDFQKENYRLKNQNSMLETNLGAIPENMVKNFYKYFKLGNNDRVTVYRVKDNEMFIPVGRFSESPLFKHKGRQEYPIDAGFIGRCWAEEEVKVINLPNYNRGHQSYINEVKKKCNIDEDVIKELKMKSRSFYCKRLKFNGDEALAVIVIESLDATLPLDPEQCKLFLDGPFGKALVEMIKNNLPIGEVNNNA